MSAKDRIMVIDHTEDVPTAPWTIPQTAAEFEVAKKILHEQVFYSSVFTSCLQIFIVNLVFFCFR